jgi:stearoyl-CoA desaturase (delta-9 desaturase)
MNFTLSNNAKVKILQAFVYIVSICTVVFAFDLTLFLVALVLGWITFGIAGSICLHKLSSHRSFVPKNKLIKWIILWFGTIGSLGSTICWAAGHREHHEHSDLKTDPHRPFGSPFHKFKMWFYYFPTWDISPAIVADLLRDKDHVFFHKHYYKIVLSYIIFLGILNPIYIGYFYAIPVLYLLFGISWATVIAHIPQLGYKSFRTYNSRDYTYNSHMWGIILAGEGYHNTHHSNPWLWNTALCKGEFDLTAPIIKLIGIPNDIPPKPFDEPRTGFALVEELRVVKFNLENGGHE